MIRVAQLIISVILVFLSAMGVVGNLMTEKPQNAMLMGLFLLCGVFIMAMAILDKGNE